MAASRSKKSTNIKTIAPESAPFTDYGDAQVTLGAPNYTFVKVIVSILVTVVVGLLILIYFRPVFFNTLYQQSASEPVPSSNQASNPEVKADTTGDQASTSPIDNESSVNIYGDHELAMISSSAAIAVDDIIITDEANSTQVRLVVTVHNFSDQGFNSLPGYLALVDKENTQHQPLDHSNDPLVLSQEVTSTHSHQEEVVFSIPADQATNLKLMYFPDTTEQPVVQINLGYNSED